MNEITNNIAKALRDPLKYIAAPIIYLLYSSTLILYGYLIQPWMVNKAHKEYQSLIFLIEQMGRV